MLAKSCSSGLGFNTCTFGDNTIDPIEGYLMTDLTGLGRSGGPLLSQAVVTDGNWHRIGLVWDGSHITLYVDGIAVAQDTPNGLANSSNGLNIGCGPTFEPNSFFSGMIDDVRVYNRAVRPIPSGLG